MWSWFLTLAGGPAAWLAAFQGMMAVTSVPRIALFAANGAIAGDLRSTVKNLIWYGSWAFLGMCLFQLYGKWDNLWHEELLAQESGCRKLHGCGLMSEANKHDPKQIRLCGEHRAQCHRNPSYRALERLTVLPSWEELTSSWLFIIVTACFVLACFSGTLAAISSTCACYRKRSAKASADMLARAVLTAAGKRPKGKEAS
jgi:hypothetical protein